MSGGKMKLPDDGGDKKVDDPVIVDSFLTSEFWKVLFHQAKNQIAELKMFWKNNFLIGTTNIQ